MSFYDLYAKNMLEGKKIKPTNTVWDYELAGDDEDALLSLSRNQQIGVIFQACLMI